MRDHEEYGRMCGGKGEVMCKRLMMMMAMERKEEEVEVTGLAGKRRTLHGVAN